MFFFFSNISHLATFFLFTCTSGVGTKGEVGGLTGVRGGAVLTDREEEEELKGEVSTFDLYSSVTS